MRRITLLVVPSVVLAVACGMSETSPPTASPGVELPAGAAEAAAGITTGQLLADVSALASDEMEGRYPGSAGDRRARAYLAERLAGMGFEPAFGPGRWEQPVPLVGVTAQLPEIWEFRGPEGDSVGFRLEDEYVGGSGVQRSRVAFDGAEVVFVGYGIQAPEEGWDDFKGEDVAGKVLLMLNDDPDWDPDLFAGERRLYAGRWSYKYESAARQGAAAAIIIHTTESAGYPWAVVQTGWRGEQVELAAGDEPRTLLNAWLTEDASRRLVALSGHDLDGLVAAARSRDFHPVLLGVTTSMAFEVDLAATDSANVGGLLPGSDPELARQVVVLSAHHDHFGVGEPDESGDTIYNGALDNGVAMAEGLAVAGAFATLPEPPRRSVLALFVAAEEQGMLGSRFFAASGAFPVGRLAANLNFEMGNVWGRTRDVMVFGRGKTDLEALLEPLAAGQGRVLVEEPDVRAGWFYRSDHFSFARAGVPAIWFKSGADFVDRPAGWGEARYATWIEEHYHRPSDEVEPTWDLEGLAEDARLAFLLAAAVATRDELPAWTPGDEFEAARLAALDPEP